MTKEERAKYQELYDNISPNNFWDFGDYCDTRDKYLCLATTMCAVAVVKVNNNTYKVGCCYDYYYGIDGIKHEISSFFSGYLGGADIKFEEVKEVEHSDFGKLVGLSIVDFGNLYNRNSRYVKILETTNEAEKKKIELTEKLWDYELDHEDDEIY